MRLEVARALGIAAPRTVVTSDPAQARQVLGDEFVVKPLSTGFFRRDDEAWAVYANRLEGSEASALEFGAAPFLAQELIVADHHYRIVTVGMSAWAARLSAAGRQLDWRQEADAHREWQPVDAPALCVEAVRLAQALHIGYSSQDWIGSTRGTTFLDLNPGGQWMFLPADVSGPVTEAIASFLVGEDAG